MGLDSFSSGDDDDDEEETSSPTETTETKEQDNITDPVEESDMSFYGTGDGEPGTTPMERVGAMSNYSTAELAQTVDGDLEFDKDSAKLHLPIFTLITVDEKYNSGERYSMKHTKEKPKASWDGRVVACIGSITTRLGNMNKEVAMFDAGSHSKKRVMENMEERLGEGVDADTTIHINFFGDALHLRDMAQANEVFREGELINRDDVVGKAMKPNQLRVALDKRTEDDE